VGAVALAFLASVTLARTYSALHVPRGEFIAAPVPWISLEGLSVDLGLRLDPLSIVMLLVVTGVGLAIHLYSRGYMAGDPSYPRFFASLSLFMFSMLGIVMASNFCPAVRLLGLVGLSGYLLIGFWYEAPPPTPRKAFLTASAILDSSSGSPSSGRRWVRWISSTFRARSPRTRRPSAP
jgi:NADH-quinone oxidoreductase subunit L